MIDWDTHRIIDMIPSRDTNTVSQWLSTYPNIEMISRDGASGYASASTKAHPNAIQVTDRFHLLKNLSEVVDRYIKNTFPSRVEIAASTDVSEEMKCLYDTANRAQRIRYAHAKRAEGLTIQEIAYLLHSGCKTIEKYLAIPENEIPEDRHIQRERQHQEAVKHKEEEISDIKQMYKEGMCIAEIAKATHHTPKTVEAYLDPNYSVVSGHYDRKRYGKMAAYEKEVIEMRAAGRTYTEIYDTIKLKGYSGTVAAIRMYMQKERVHAKSVKRAEGKDIVHRITLTQLVYHKLEEVKLITKGQYEALLRQYPELAGLYSLIKEFHEILFSKKAANLNGWVKKASLFAIPELQTFLGGLNQDCAAVRNAIKYDYNNGLAEGRRV
ncbi:Transposase [[Clostridium] aminophilum]|uniref:Transposase n=2 Tax=[Clostridium] aminophilum TaxID=1526 RepID=A0A1I0GNH6_9FIRM|nr:Transposase [[Clostridium] aminophilum]